MQEQIKVANHNFNPLRREGGDYNELLELQGRNIYFNPLRREGGDPLLVQLDLNKLTI